ALAVRAARSPVRDDGPPPRTWRSRTVAGLGLAAAAGLIAGPIALALTGIGLLVDHIGPSRWPKILVALAGGGTAICAAALSTGPWRSFEGYAGGSLWVQFPALVAVIAVGLAALPDKR
ncbi:hypothetical protein, partial [Nocardia sp. NPDC004722]